MGRRTLQVSDLVYLTLTDDELDHCIDTARTVYRHIVDRSDLHPRDNLERFENVLLGEIAEFSVIKWLREAGKYVESAVDKHAPVPDPGHDLIVRTVDGRTVRCSIKSSLSFHYSSPEAILSQMTIATKKSEVREINIQVYFWYRLHPAAGESRITLPATRMAAIVGWFGQKDLEGDYGHYNHEQRESPRQKLETGRPIATLLEFLV